MGNKEIKVGTANLIVVLLIAIIILSCEVVRSHRAEVAASVDGQAQGFAECSNQF